MEEQDSSHRQNAKTEHREDPRGETGDQLRTFSGRADCTRSSVRFRDTSFGRTICPENPQEVSPQDLLYILSAIAPVQ